MASINHKRDSRLRYNKKGHNNADVPKEFSLDDGSNVKPKNRSYLFSTPSPLLGMRYKGLGREGDNALTPARAFGGGREHHDSQNQTGEFTPTCLGLKSKFKWSNIFKPWKKNSKQQQQEASLPPPPSQGTNEAAKEETIMNRIHPDEFNMEPPPLTIYRLSQLRRATKDFSPERLIGRGGYAEVFKGRMRDGKYVAVKRLCKETAKGERDSTFASELRVISHLDHPNTSKLLGCSSDGGEFCLVFELSPVGSLASILHGPDKYKLTWSRRYRIALGIANGLLYLHDHCHRRIVHRDIKAENVLLTQKFEPQICDFGLAKWMPEDNRDQLVTTFEGTFGYFAPEYLTHGIVNDKTDVYAFGILLLELITGRKALDYMQQSILLWAKPWLDANNIKELVDPCLGDNYDRDQMERLVLTASLCVEQSPLLRPRMNQALVLLRGDDHVVELRNGIPRRYLPGVDPEPAEEDLQDAIEIDCS